MEHDWQWECCEYCNRDDVVLYAWHGDVWCAECATKDRVLGIYRMVGSLEEAPIGRPENATYEQPFVYQTPDRRVLRGLIQGA